MKRSDIKIGREYVVALVDNIVVSKLRVVPAPDDLPPGCGRALVRRLKSIKSPSGFTRYRGVEVTVTYHNQHGTHTDDTTLFVEDVIMPWELWEQQRRRHASDQRFDAAEEEYHAGD